MRRFWIFGLGLVLWQAVSVGFGAVEFAYDQPPPVPALLASLVTVVGWVALGIWAGRTALSVYLWFAGVVWLGILGALIVVMLALAAEGDSVGPWHDALIVPILFAGGPLHPLAHYVPLADPLHRTMVVAGAMLVVSVGSYFTTRTPSSQQPADIASAP